MSDKILPIDSQKVYEVGFLNNLNIVIVCEAITHKILLVNQTFESIVGIKLPDSLNLTIEALSCWRNAEHLSNLIKSVEEGKPLLNAEIEMVNVSDNWQFALLTIRQEKINGQNVFFCHFHDITYRKQCALELQKSEKTLDRAQEIAKLGSYSWDLKTNEIIWSSEMYHIFQIESATKGQALWDQFNKLVHPDDQYKLNDAVQMLFNEQRSMPIEYRIIVAANQQQKIVYANGDIVFDKSGIPVEVVGFVQDVSEQRLAEFALQKSQAMLRKVLDSIPVRVYWKDKNLKYLGCNHLFAEDVGLDNVEDVFGKTDNDLTWCSQAEQIFQQDSEILRQEKQVIESQLSIRGSDGLVRHFDSCKVLLADENNETIGMLGIYEDVTEKKNIENIKNRLLDILEATPDLVGMFDISGKIKYLNMAGRKLLKVQVDADLSDARIEDFHSSKYAEHLENIAIPYAKKHQAWRGENVFRTTLGQDIPTSQVLIAHKDENKNIHYYSTIARDMSERNAYLAALEHQANHDPLTRLANRNLLYKVAEKEIQHAQLAGESVALILMDLDRFKEINDTLGHHTGDLLLKQIGPRFAMRADDSFRLMARLGGDEFAILISGIERDGKVDKVVKSILEGIKLPFELDGLRVEIDASIGVAIYPENGESVSTLMRCADVAMYHAKHHKLGFSYYSTEHDQHSSRRLSLMTELGKALRNNELDLHFQPKINIKNNTISGFEALLRWNHPQYGDIPPSQFIPLAETGELIRPLTLWVLEKAIKHCKTWLKSGFDAHVAVNMSVRNLMDEGYAEQIEKMLEAHGLAPKYLELEITESAVMSDPTRALNNLQRLNEYGIKLAIDDFGTGYSSLVYLKRLPIQSLKIDLSFVTNMIENEQDAIIVNSIVNLAHNLGLKVIAEGVKSQAILDALGLHGCDEAQGFYIGKPMNIIQVGEYLVSRESLCEVGD